MIFPTHIARVYIGRTAAIIPEFLVIFKLSFSARIVKYERSYWWMHWPRLHRKDHCLAGVFGKPVKVFSFYRTRVRSLAALVPNSLTHSLINRTKSNIVVETWLMWPRLVKMPTQNLLICLLIVVHDEEQFGRDFDTEDCSRYQGWGLVKILMLKFSWGS